MRAFSGKYKHFSVFRLSLALLIVNAIGAIAYVRAVQPSWVIPEERAAGIHSVTGEPFVWFVAVLPFVIGFGLLNAFWGVGICVWKKWRSGYFWFAAALIWLIAVAIDFAHHR
jgi:hypothetical protein